MLHQTYLLESDAGAVLRLRPLPQKTWQPALVVPRALCVFESVPCRGLAWYERARFARLQAQRLAPFSNTGFNACVRGKTLMLWLWDQAEIQNATLEAKLDGQRTRLWAEPLLRAAPLGLGERRLVCSAGIDVQTLAGAAITASHWLAGSNEASQAPAMRRWPWAWELANQRLSPGGETASKRTWSWPSAWRMASASALVASASYAGFWGAQLLGARTQLTAYQAEAENSTRRLGDLASLRLQSSDSAGWVQRYEQFSAGIQWPALLAALAPALEKYGVVMKEMEVREDEVKFTVASAGSDIDMPALLRALVATKGISNVQLRTTLDFSQATFSLRATGYLRAAGVRLSEGTP